LLGILAKNRYCLLACREKTKLDLSVGPVFFSFPPRQVQHFFFKATKKYIQISFTSNKKGNKEATQQQASKVGNGSSSASE
jgi:hypothetical protein